MKKYIQGDVIIREAQIPKGAHRIKSKVLAEGEQTGHAHVVDQFADLYRDENNRLFLRADHGEPATATHQEHNPVEISEGEYTIQIVREFDYESFEERQIRD